MYRKAPSNWSVARLLTTDSIFWSRFQSVMLPTEPNPCKPRYRRADNSNDDNEGNPSQR